MSPTTLNIAPQPTCGDVFALAANVSVSCDRPAGHLPEDDHARTVRWKTLISRARARASESCGDCMKVRPFKCPRHGR